MSSHTHDVYASYSRYVTANNVVVRKKASNKGKIVGSYKKAANITTYSGVYCYVSSQYLSESRPEEDTWETYGTATGQSVVDYAMQFRGNPYVWGGESLTNGVDCSGFTMQVYKHFGYSLPHSSTAQRYEGTAVSWNEKQPGDLICYQVVNGVGHVAIYIGDNQIIHAGSKDTGINVRNADYRAVWGVRRIVQ